MIFDWHRWIAVGGKAWMESRAVFGACLFITFVNSWLALDRAYEGVLARRVLHPSPFEVLDGTYRVWAILFAILGAGCMLWEGRQGGFAFSSSLPVRMAHFNLIRAAVGLAQVAFLASMPNLVAGSIHEFLRPAMPLPFLLSFTTAGIALGAATFGLAFLMSAFVKNLYMAIGLGWISSVVTSYFFAALPFTDSLAGMTLLRSLGTLPAKPMAWYPVSAYATFAIVFIAAGAYIAESRQQVEVR